MSAEVLPLILTDKYFKVVHKFPDGQVTAECASCTNKTQIKGAIHSTTNFKTHLKRCHSGKVKEYESELKLQPKRRRLSGVSNQEKPLDAYIKKDKSKSVSRDDKLLINLVVKGMLPLHICEQTWFIEYSQGLKSDVQLMSRRTLQRRIDDLYIEKQAEIKSKLNGADFVCLTSDVWTCNGMSRSFLGVTAHFITDKLERQSFALACRRFPGSHTYDKIADLLLSIVREYDIPVSKITKIVTDNGRNFVKAFHEFGIDFETEDESDSVIDQTLAIEPEDVGVILGSVVSAKQRLPSHHRCSSHTLSLIATADLSKQANHRLHKSSFSKCSGMWNKIGRSTIAAESAKEICGYSLKTPCKTRWNSLYDSLLSLLKSKEKLTALANAVGIPRFTDEEVEYLEGYMEVLKPIAVALDRLQKQTSMYFGELYPTILTTLKRLESLQQNCETNFRDTVSCIIEGYKRRFSSFLDFSGDHEDAIIASISHPEFKLRWIPSSKREEFKTAFIKKVSDETGDLNFEEKTSSAIESSDDFFLFEDETSNTGVSDVSQSHINQIRQECLDYFLEKGTKLKILNQFPRVRKIFVKYNTALPSSAPVERLFSFAGMILAAKRQRLNDGNFEKLTLLKYN